MTGPSATRPPPAPPTEPDTTQVIPDLSSLADAVARELRTHDFAVRIPTSENCCHLKITNVPSTTADLTIYKNGLVEWQSHCFDGPHDWKQIAGVTLDILNADDWPTDPGRMTAYPAPHLNLLGRIALAATAHDLRIAFDPVDPANADLLIYDELTVTNPAQPNRGAVRITNDGVTNWRCRIRGESHGADGLYLNQMTSAIKLALTSARIAQHGKQPAYTVS